MYLLYTLNVGYITFFIGVRLAFMVYLNVFVIYPDFVLTNLSLLFFRRISLSSAKQSFH